MNTSILELVVDGGFVIYRSLASGVMSLELQTSISYTFDPEAPVDQGLTAEQGNVYWGSGPRIFSCSDRCDKTNRRLVATVAGAVTGVSLDKEYVYFSDGLGAIARCPRGTGCSSQVPPHVIAKDSRGALGVAVHGDRVFWISCPGGKPLEFQCPAGSIKTCPAAGCLADPGIVASDLVNPMQIVADDESIYWTNSGTLRADPPTDGSVVRCPLTGCNGKPKVLAAALEHPSAITLDSRGVYWMTRGSVQLDTSVERGGSVMFFPTK